METQATIIHVPLSQLRLSTKNTRKRRTAESIERIAASLRAHGQLQNLVVTQGDGGVFDVDAGGTRLLAFQQLQAAGDIEADHLVDCKLIAADSAIEASAAENSLREAMHPADQFRAFRQMIDGGSSVDDVAAHFSVAPSVVTQRLKLANVAPDLFELFEADKMRLDQLQALALTDDHDAQHRAWFGTKGAKLEHDWQRQAHELRKRITAKEVGPDNPLVRFVGADLYEAAGGAVRRDMFSTDVYFADAKLLETLANNKIEAIALQERNAGWSWVETHLEMDYSAQSRYAEGPFRATYGKISKEAQARIDEIQVRLTQIEALDDSDESIDFDAVNEEIECLESELSDLRAGNAEWSAEAKAKTGVLIYLDRYNGLQIQRGRVRPGQRVTAGKVTGEAKSSTAKATLSQDMVQRLEMHRAAATREHIAARPAAALELLLVHLVTQHFTSSFEAPLALRAVNAHRDARSHIDAKFHDLGKAPARKAIEDRLAAWKKAGLPTKVSDVAGWVSKLTQAKQLELLALFVALAVDTNGGARGQALADRFEVDMTAWWSPTPDSFISLVPKALLAEAVADAAGKAAGEAVLAMKKDAAMAEAAKRLAGTGWLPKPLRGATYAKAATLKTAAKKAAPAKKSAAKKAAPAKTTTKKGKK